MSFSPLGLGRSGRVSAKMGGKAQRRREKNWIQAKLGVEERAKRDLPKGEIERKEFERPPKGVRHVMEFRSGESEKKRQELKRKKWEQEERTREEKKDQTRSMRFKREKEEKQNGSPKRQDDGKELGKPQVMHTSQEIEATEAQRNEKNKRKGFLQLRKEKKRSKRKDQSDRTEEEPRATTKTEPVAFGETADKPPDITLRRKGMPGTETGRKNQERLSHLFQKQFRDAQAKAAGKPTSKEIRRKSKQPAPKPLVDEKMRLELIQAYRKKRGHLL